MNWIKIDDENYIGRGYLNYNLVKLIGTSGLWVSDVDGRTHDDFFMKGSFEECKVVCEMDNIDWEYNCGEKY